MGKLTLSQKLIAATASYEIKDGKTVVYTAKRKLIALGSDFEICKDGQVVAKIDQKIANLVKTYAIEIYGQPAGVIKKKFPALTKDLTYEARGWKVDGDLAGLNFKIIDGNKNVYATIKKKLIALGDTYELEYNDPNDELITIVLAIIADEAFSSKRS